MEIEYIIILITFVICILALILNIIGLYILVNLKRPFSNQVKIIMSISLLDIIILFLATTMKVLQLVEIKEQLLHQYLWLFMSAFYFVWYMAFDLMMLDRCFSCCFPFWYRTYAASRWVSISLVLFWSSPLITIPVIALSNIKKTMDFSYTYAWMAFDVIFICGFIVLYGIIFEVKRRSNVQTRRNAAQPENKRFIKVVSAMLITFLILEAIPTTFVSFLNIESKHEAANGLFTYMTLIWRLNLLADPLIYIFMQPNIIARLRTLWLCCKNCTGRAKPVNNIAVVRPAYMDTKL